ncbi:MAG: PHP domain-containing protein [Clostridiales Family XIII bacterium]|jgi:predicted metal-dependent phosphoesterase TrpH|nr:PHP domain-containing protein [Clostridiales Family XIII bacterium]
MALVDLHLHSNMSDGEYSPAAVVSLAAGAGLRVIALTDHDTTDGIDEALSAASTLNAGTTPHTDDAFVCLPGIEITTAHEREQHILGYLIDRESASFKEFVKRLIILRRERADNILDYLNKMGVRLSYQHVEQLSGNAYIGRPQIAAAMVDVGKAASIRAAFQGYLTGHEFHKISRPKPSAEESIDQIRASGGVAVLAHPDSLGLCDMELAAHLRTLKEQGLRGIECHYGSYTRARTERYISIADSLGLLVTGGSDFHGPHVKPGVLIATGVDGMLDFDDISIVDRLALDIY